MLNDQSGPYPTTRARARSTPPDSPSRISAARSGIRSRSCRRPPEQDRHRRRDRPRWYDQDGVDLIVDVPNSAVALAVSTLAREKNRVFIGSGAGTAELTGRQCSPNTIHWTYDTWRSATGCQGAGRPGRPELVLHHRRLHLRQGSGGERRRGGRSGRRQRQGQRPPPDRQQRLLVLPAPGQASGADVIGVANAGDDTSNTLKQAFGIRHRPGPAPRRPDPQRHPHAGARLR